MVIPLTVTDQIEDKRRILGAGFISVSKPDNLNRVLFERVLSRFLEEDKYHFLNYRSAGSLKNSANALANRFNSYKSTILDRRRQAIEIAEILETKKKDIEPYVRIIERSLPPRRLEEQTDKSNPAFTTKIISPELPEPPKKFSYVIQEKMTKETGEGKLVIKQSSKIVKPHRLDFSVGLAYTTKEYYVTSQKNNELPSSNVGDRLQFTAGVHIYCIHRLNKLHDEWFGYPKERFSIYLGLSIAHALDNYYTGISYDPTPGIRVIAGAHFYKNYRFKISNNQVVEKATGIGTAGVFFSVSLEPLIFLK